VTSTLEKTLLPSVEPGEPLTLSPSEPLTENILATKAPIGYESSLSLPLDSSVATLPPIGLGPDQSTPPLETMTETFSTTQLLLKTHILPVVRGGGNTTLYTLVQSYHVTRLVTATKVCIEQSLVRESIANPYMDFQKSTDINMDIHDFWMSVFNYPYKRGFPH